MTVALHRTARDPGRRRRLVWLVLEQSDRTNRNTLVKPMFGSWAQGYLSGMNDLRSRALKAEVKNLPLLPDVDAILAYVDKYCRENPRIR
jgi:hypothetical protein